jgi:hypothetical protein
MELQWWSGSSWITDQIYDDNDHGNHKRDTIVEFTSPVTTTRIRMKDMKTFTTNSNIMIQEWEVFGALTGGDPYEMNGLGTGTCDVTIENVFPTAVVPDNYPDVVDEQTTITFEGFSITDPALMARTEAFWYRWDFGDGTPVGDWIYKGVIAPPPLNVLLLHSWGSYQSEIINGLSAEFADQGFEILTLDDYNFGPLGTNTIPPLSLLMGYDVVVVSMDYYIFSTPMVNDLGNKLADYSDAGGGVVQMTFSAGSAYYSQVAGRWMAEDYNPIGYAGNHYGYVSLGDVHDCPYGLWEDVNSFQAYYKHGTSTVNNGDLCGEYSNGYVLAAHTDADHHAVGGGIIIGLNFFPWWSYTQGDSARLLVNAIVAAWGEEIPDEFLTPVEHDYGDNGIYTAGLQLIDDDMYWKAASQPVFTGPGNEEDWISYSFFPVEVLNVDPVIHGIRAELNLDLVIRTTGEPNNDCTMTLWQGATALGQVTVHHEGNYKMETLPATLNVANINDYYITVEYENADPDGANPTWVFEGRFPSGHTKELKNVFKEDGTLWVIDSSLLKPMLLGEDITFMAPGSDVGSDDLAYDWNFDDGGDGIHVYPNENPSDMAVGTEAAPEDIFNAHVDRDPAFDRPLNDERSPELNPIRVVDEISHAFDEAGYYFVTLLLMDDDVCDG